ncbi:hypothetical protein EYF80_034868 [Liparis tanakae]|uniref:Uncharacterized protein n=1 Tax=Liparis tanakae TaxID=230148 RepID=A0A4Z2GQ72_9TELE|nr:hypothetical protein EYF80_034868 [Liparis tanakae]
MRTETGRETRRRGDGEEAFWRALRRLKRQIVEVRVTKQRTRSQRGNLPRGEEDAGGGAGFQQEGKKHTEEPSGTENGSSE